MTIAHVILFWAWLLTPPPDVTHTQLKKPAAEAFDQYIRTSEARLDKELQTGAFLWVDGAAARQQAVRQGKVMAEPWTGSGDITVPDGLIHDWVAAVFIPGGKLEKTIAMVEDYNNHKNIYKPEVSGSKLLNRDGNNFQIFLRLVKKQVLTVTLNTNHDVHYYPVDSSRWYSRSYATRIAEVDHAGASDEKELTPGEDHGFLWRLNSYWRFQERDGGVYVECEAISLTRDVPSGLGWLINPIIRNLPRNSLVSTLRATREAALQRQ